MLQVKQESQISITKKKILFIIANDFFFFPSASKSHLTNAEKKSQTLFVIVNCEFEKCMNMNIGKPLHLFRGNFLYNICSNQQECNLNAPNLCL